MKWAIIILVVLGVVAAACASLLVGAMRAGSDESPENPQGVEVSVARRSLQAMTVVTLDDLVKKTVSKNELPKGQVAGPTRVIGRVLSVPVVEGQILTDSCFVSEGTGAQLAAALPEGMRAYTVNLNSRAVPDSLLLYPGCVVDVIFSAKLSSQDIRGQALSATILRGIQVLAVAGESVVSNPEAEEGNEAKARNRNGGLQVTLLVDSKQAEALQLAVDNGNISLAVRNPLDKSLGEMEATVLNQGQMAAFGSALTPEILAATQKARQKEQEQNWLQSQIVAPGDVGEKEQAEPSVAPAQRPQPNQDYQVPKHPRWGITVIRGRETKTEEFDVSRSEATVASR